MITGSLAKSLRMQKGYTIAVVAHYLDVNPSQLSQFERGKISTIATSSKRLEDLLLILQSDISSEDQKVINKKYYEKKKAGMARRLAQKTVQTEIIKLKKEIRSKEQYKYFMEHSTFENIDEIEKLIRKLNEMKREIKKKFEDK